MRAPSFTATVVLLAVVSLASLLSGHYLWRQPGGDSFTTAPDRIVYVAQEPPVFAEAPREPLPPGRCEKLRQIADARLLAEIARRHLLPDLAPRAPLTPEQRAELEAIPPEELTPEQIELLAPPRSLLTLVRDPTRYRWGVETAVTLGEGEDRPRVTNVALDPPLYAARHDKRFKVGLGGDASRDGVEPVVALGFEYRRAQTKRVDHGIEITALIERDPRVVALYTAAWGDF